MCPAGNVTGRALNKVHLPVVPRIYGRRLPNWGGLYRQLPSILFNTLRREAFRATPIVIPVLDTGMTT